MATLEARIKAMLDILGPDIKSVLTGLSSITTVSTSSTSYTLVLTDAGKHIETTSNFSVTLIIPPNSSVAFPVGTVIEITQVGSGVVTITADSGVTLQVRSSTVKTAGQWAVASLRKRATDEWVLTGDLTV